LKLTFVDSGVLIAAARGSDEAARRAFAVLDDPQRSFVSSDFLRLEVLPKACFQKRLEEVSFYEDFFGRVEIWVEPDPGFMAKTLTVAQENGLAALDALHGTAALVSNAVEIVTTEKEGRPIHRLKNITVQTIHPGRA
jgi:predicted nucleic acid-binding protein